LQTFSYTSLNNFYESSKNNQTIRCVNLIDEYLNVNRNLPKFLTRLKLISLFEDAQELNLNHVNLPIETISKLLSQLNADYDIFIKDFVDHDAYLKFKDFYDNFKKIIVNIENKKMLISINNLFLETNVDFSVFVIDMYTQKLSPDSDNKLKLVFLNHDNSFVFKQDLKVFSNQEFNDLTIPVIATNYFASINKYKVGDIVKNVPISMNNATAKIDLKIIKINDDNVSNNFYTSEEKMQNLLKQPIIHNEVFTTRQTIDDKGNYLANYANVLYAPNKNGEIHLSDIYGQKFINYVNPLNSGSLNFSSFSLERKLIKNKSTTFNNLMDSIILISFFLVLILFVVYSFVVTNNNIDKIYILKSIGYTDKEITNYVNYDYFSIAFFSILMSSLLALGL